MQKNKKMKPNSNSRDVKKKEMKKKSPRYLNFEVTNRTGDNLIAKFITTTVKCSTNWAKRGWRFYSKNSQWVNILIFINAFTLLWCCMLGKSVCILHTIYIILIIKIIKNHPNSYTITIKAYHLTKNKKCHHQNLLSLVVN